MGSQLYFFTIKCWGGCSNSVALSRGIEGFDVNKLKLKLDKTEVLLVQKSMIQVLDLQTVLNRVSFSVLEHFCSVGGSSRLTAARGLSSGGW